MTKMITDTNGTHERNLANELNQDLTIDYGNEIMYFGDKFRAFIENAQGDFADRVRIMTKQIDYLLAFYVINVPVGLDIADPADVCDTLVQFWFPDVRELILFDERTIKIDESHRIYSISFPCISDY